VPFSRQNRHLTLALALVAAGLIVIGGGAQAYLVQKDNAGRDRADRRYADCLTDFAADLVETLRAVRDANQDVTEARNRKDAALDELLELTAQAQASGAKTNDELPRDLVRRYRAALRERIDAQRDYSKAIAEATRTQAENPYVSPKVVCRR
jgi:hypothetical protein